MKAETGEHLRSVLEHGRQILEFTRGLALESYSRDAKTKLAVERSFEIIGEAFKRVARDEPDLLQWVPEHRQVISFRNILAHGYDSIEDKIVWGVIQQSLPKLLKDVEDLLARTGH